MRRLAGVALALGIVLLPSTRARALDEEIQITDTQYTPASLVITVGEKVTWTYSGSDAHSVTSDDGSFDSSPSCLAGVGCMGNGSSFPHTFNDLGTFTYHCKVHAMTGTIIVQAASTTTSSTSTSTSTTVTTSSSAASTSLSSDQPTITQAALPSPPGGRVLPKSIIRAGRTEDDVRPWVFLDVGIAGATAIIGAVLVRRGRVLFG